MTLKKNNKTSHFRFSIETDGDSEKQVWLLEVFDAADHAKASLEEISMRAHCLEQNLRKTIAADQPFATRR